MPKNIPSLSMDDFILLSTLNDFIFCPYSIYLHNVYTGGDESLVHAAPQTRGKSAHESIDEGRYSSRSDILTGTSVYCSELGIAGKIDIFKISEKLLIERKYQLDKIYRGQIYQLWGQFFCLTEMGYRVDRLSFYIISSNKMMPVELPGETGWNEMKEFIRRFREYNPSHPMKINLNKCKHCIYSNLCDKTDTDHVYA